MTTIMGEGVTGTVYLADNSWGGKYRRTAWKMWELSDVDCQNIGPTFLHWTKMAVPSWLFMFYLLSICLSQSDLSSSIKHNTLKRKKKCALFVWSCPSLTADQRALFAPIVAPLVTYPVYMSITFTFSLWQTHKRWRDSTKGLGFSRLISASFCVDTVFHAVCKKLQRFSASHSVG